MRALFRNLHFNREVEGREHSACKANTWLLFLVIPQSLPSFTFSSLSAKCLACCVFFFLLSEMSLMTQSAVKMVYAAWREVKKEPN